MGRDAEEQALLGYCVAHTAAVTPGDDVALACVSGPSGVGKSRLVAEVKRSLQLAGVPVLESTCYEGALDELGPLRDAIQAAVRLGRAYEVEGLEDRYRATLDWLVAGAAQPARSLAEEESLRAAALRDLADLVLDLSASIGIVLSIGDLHWALTSTTDFLKVLCDRQAARRDAGRAARLAVVVTHRDDEATVPLEDLLTAVGPDRRLTLALSPLPPAHTAQLVASMLGVSDVPRPFTHRVAAETGGNPFFVEEVMRALMERGDVSLEAGRWAARTDVAHIELPPTMAAVLERRLASVGAHARDVLEWLAVYAQPMPQALLVEATGMGADRVHEALQTLVERHMAVAAGAGRFRPAHDKLRELLNARMSPSDRPARHAAVARALERAARGDTEYVIERAHHYWHARDLEQARVWAERAARLAEQTFATDAAVVNCERLRELAERRGDEAARRNAVDRLLDLLAVLGQFDRLLAIAEEELAHRTEPLERARIYRVQGETLGAAGQLAEGIEKLRDAAALLGTEIPRAPRARRLYVAHHFVRVLAALALGGADPAHARRLAPDDRRRRELLGSCLWLMGVYSALHGDEAGYGLVFPGIHAMLPLGRHHVLTKLLINGAFASHIIGRYGASARLARAAQRVADSEEERAVVLAISVMARQLAQRPIVPEQPPVQTLEPDLLRAVDLLSTRSRAVHANVARMVATIAVYKYAERHERRPEVARWAEAMRGTVHYGFVQAAVAAMAQIDGDRRRADHAYERAYAGCTTDVYRTWVAGDFAFVCAVTGEVEKAIGLRRDRPAAPADIDHAERPVPVGDDDGRRRVRRAGRAPREPAVAADLARGANRQARSASQPSARRAAVPPGRSRRARAVLSSRPRGRTARLARLVDGGERKGRLPRSRAGRRARAASHGQGGRREGRRRVGRGGGRRGGRAVPIGLRRARTRPAGPPCDALIDALSRMKANVTAAPGRSSVRDPPEPPAVHVGDRLLDLLERVHDERAVGDDRLVQGLTREQDDVRLLLGDELETCPVVGEEDELPGVCRVRARADPTLRHDGHGVVGRRERDRQPATGRQVGVEHRDRREGVGGTAYAVEFARDDTDVPAAAVRQRHPRDVRLRDRLIPGRRHLLRARQVHPELHHVHAPAAPGERLLVVLLVEDAGARRHPLHVARADDSRVAGVVPVRDRTFPGEGHRLEATVRVPAHAALAAGGGGELFARAVVHEHERADPLGGETPAGKIGGDEEAVADPVERGALVNALDAAQGGGCRRRKRGGRGRGVHCAQRKHGEATRIGCGTQRSVARRQPSLGRLAAGSPREGWTARMPVAKRWGPSPDHLACGLVTPPVGVTLPSRVHIASYGLPTLPPMHVYVAVVPQPVAL